jgi:hypothetical protein
LASPMRVWWQPETNLMLFITFVMNYIWHVIQKYAEHTCCWNLTEVTADKIFLTVLCFLAFKEQQGVSSVPELKLGIRGNRRADGSLILNYPKPDYTKISSKVDCWRKSDMCSSTSDDLLNMTAC